MMTQRDYGVLDIFEQPSGAMKVPEFPKGAQYE